MTLTKIGKKKNLEGGGDEMSRFLRIYVLFHFKVPVHKYLFFSNYGLTQANWLVPISVFAQNDYRRLLRQLSQTISIVGPWWKIQM